MPGRSERPAKRAPARGLRTASDSRTPQCLARPGRRAPPRRPDRPEYLLVREGYAVEAFAAGEPFVAAPGPVLLLVAGDDGLYVFLSGDAAETIDGFVPGNGSCPGVLSGAVGIRAFLPKPFGIGDVLRVVRMVDGFEGRRRAFAEDVADTTGEDG